MFARFITLSMVTIVGFAPASRADITGSTQIASGLSQPIFATHAPGDTSRLFIVERTGSIRIFDRTTGSVLTQPFLNNIGVSTSGEGGLFSLAFHPDYATNGRFFISGTFANGGQSFQGASAGFSSHVREYQVSNTDPNIADTSFTEVISWVQPQSNHNGGWIGFSPNDGYLYIGSGDGGGSNDNESNGHTPGTGNAQDITNNFHGKMLRIDVDDDDFEMDNDRNYAIPESNPFVGVTGDDEIWAYGLRNPWRSSFDRETGDLWIGDVGQGQREEVNFQPADSAGGENYGWRIKEASLVTGLTPGASTAGLIDPIYEYTRGTGALQGRSVTGGYVYRGADNDLRGDYIFGDYRDNNIWRYNQNNTPIIENINSDLDPNAGTIGSVASFGDDADGNLYIMDLFGGEVFRIDTDIMIAGDYDGSGTVDAGDYATWRSQFGSTGVFAADGNHDGRVDAADYTVWRDNLGRVFGGGALQVGAVPEPTSLAAGTALLLGFVAARRGRESFSSQSHE